MFHKRCKCKCSKYFKKKSQGEILEEKYNNAKNQNKDYVISKLVKSDYFWTSFELQSLHYSVEKSLT